jgi:dihydroorotase
MLSNYFIQNGTIISDGLKFHGNILIINGIIHDIFDHDNLSENFIRENNIQRIDATGLIVMPGVIDDQVHFREPGLTQKGTIFSESRSAVAGGVTSFMEMPNTVPNTVSIDLLEEKYKLAAESSVANYSFYLGATNDNFEELKKFDPGKNAGLKLFLGSSTGNMLVNNHDTLEKIFSLPFLIAIHSEDEEIIQRNIRAYREKYGEDVPVKYHPLIRSTESCYVSTLKAFNLASKNNTRLHILHISTARELELLRNDVPLENKKITSEVCVHHLWFNDSDYEKKGTFIKWNPAIKTENDRAALFQGILDGTIDIVATDHAPHSEEEKLQTYFKAPSGGPLVQHSLLAMLEFYHDGKISLEQIVSLMAHKPAICFKVKNRGFIRKGFYADLVLTDLIQKTFVDESSLLYKCKWSPFGGYTFHSKVAYTFVNGRMAYNGEQVMDNFRGMRLEYLHP